MRMRVCTRLNSGTGSSCFGILRDLKTSAELDLRFFGITGDVASGAVKEGCKGVREQVRKAGPLDSMEIGEGDGEWLLELH